MIIDQTVTNIANTYNSQNQVVSSTITFADNTQSIDTNTYNSSNQVITRTKVYAGNTVTETYTYDANGNVTNIAIS